MRFLLIVSMTALLFGSNVATGASIDDSVMRAEMAVAVVRKLMRDDGLQDYEVASVTVEFARGSVVIERSSFKDGLDSAPVRIDPAGHYAWVTVRLVEKSGGTGGFNFVHLVDQETEELVY